MTTITLYFALCIEQTVAQKKITQKKIAHKLCITLSEFDGYNMIGRDYYQSPNIYILILACVS